MPHHNADRAREHACDRTWQVRALPIEREQHERTERRAEARPGVRNDLEDDLVLVNRDEDTKEQDQHERDARHDHDLCIGGVLLDQASEDVLCNR